MAITRPFQGRDGGSIPLTRSFHSATRTYLIKKPDSTTNQQGSRWRLPVKREYKTKSS